MIKTLPTYLINKIKAWEVIDRPASVVKEILENSLDAWADKISISIRWGWKDLIKIQDNGSWISETDLEKSIERYATSKITNEQDLENILSYGFRWEALSSISEISKFFLQSKNWQNSQAFQISKVDGIFEKKPISYNQENWTTILVQDIFYNTPARQKFLKSAQTEWDYIYNIVLNYCIIKNDVEFFLLKDDKIIFDLKPENLEKRIFSIFPTSRHQNISSFESESIWVKVFWYASNSSLSFFDDWKIHIFVNCRPVKDKIIKKAIMQSYFWNITKWKYPFVILFLEIDTNQLDVNVHPKKQEIKFLDPQKIFKLVNWAVSSSFKTNQISNAPESFLSNQKSNFHNSTSSQNQYQASSSQNQYPASSYQNILSSKNFSLPTHNQIENIKSFGQKNISETLDLEFSNQVTFEETKSYGYIPWDYKIIGQIWDAYIIAQKDDWLFLIDQHALAERIAYEKLLKKFSENLWEKSELLSPYTVEIFWAEKNLQNLEKFGFEIEHFWWKKYLISAIPLALENINFDLNNLLELDEFNITKLVESLFATQACKASIKAWDKLSFLQMQALIEDWLKNIDWFFVCQHWRPFFWQIEKWSIDKLFDR